MHHLWRYRLNQETAYDLLLSYYRIVEAGTEAPPIEHQFSLTNPSEEIRSSRRSIHIVGNYRSEGIWISPLISGQGPIPITIEPCKLGHTEAVVDQTASKTIGLKLLTLIEPKKWPRARKVNLGLALASGVALILTFLKYQEAPDATQKALLLLMAALISLLINSLKDVIIRKE